MQLLGVDLNLQYSDFFSLPFLSPSFFFFLSANFAFQCLQVDKCLTSVVFRCPCKIAAFFFFFKLQILPRDVGSSQDNFTKSNCLQWLFPAPSDLKFFACVRLRWKSISFWNGFAFGFSVPFACLFVSLGVRPLLISDHLPVSVKRICSPGVPTLPFEGLLGFVEWSREDCIVGAGLGEHTFLPQTSPFL